MLFSSPSFFAFFLVYFACHLLVPRAYRLALIVIGSTIFYAYWNPAYLWVPHTLMLIAYMGVGWLEASPGEKARRRRLVCVIAVLLAPLVFFKYTNFFYEAFLGRWPGPGHQIVTLPLPLGISFITFSLIAYVTDVFHREYPVEHAVERLDAYVTFFPHLIAGPILRPHQLIPQLVKPRRATGAQVTLGVMIFSVGLVKKLVFADQLAPAISLVYAGESPLSAAHYLLAIYGFSLQIYCDFSGYTDMAIGVATILGVRLPNNFARPYGALSVRDFWRRWHISLSRWLRDYLYIPLGGGRRGRGREVRNILVTMALGGLWHGANWTFVIWGLIHGLGVTLSHLTRGFTSVWSVSRIPRCVRLIATFHFVTIAWVFFRAPDLTTVGRVLAGPFVSDFPDGAEFLSGNAFVLVLLAVFLASHRFDEHARFRLFVRRMPAAIIWPVIIGMWILAITISTGSSAKFIYFEF